MFWNFSIYRKIPNHHIYINNASFRYTVVSHIYAYDRAKTLSFILLIRRKSTEFENE